MTKKAAEDFLIKFDKQKFTNSRGDPDPTNWVFDIGYYEEAGPESDHWFVLAIYTPTITANPETNKNKGRIIIITPDHGVSHPGNGHQDDTGIWMWNKHPK